MLSSRANRRLCFKTNERESDGGRANVNLQLPGACAHTWMCTRRHTEHKREHVNTETDRLTDDTQREIETERDRDKI